MFAAVDGSGQGRRMPVTGDHNPPGRCVQVTVDGNDREWRACV